MWSERLHRADTGCGKLPSKPQGLWETCLSLGRKSRSEQKLSEGLLFHESLSVLLFFPPTGAGALSVTFTSISLLVVCAHMCAGVHRGHREGQLPGLESQVAAGTLTQGPWQNF